MARIVGRENLVDDVEIALVPDLFIESLDERLSTHVHCLPFPTGTEISQMPAS